ncbi:hypothetical protein, partial [Bacillus subtilis]|uniref:hypothetical protein n=1 Tax=Bacillus subtilis TaxID=1423 RepID=UPI00338E91B2
INTAKQAFMVFYITLFLILSLPPPFPLPIKQLYLHHLFHKPLIQTLQKQPNHHAHAHPIIKHRLLYISPLTVTRFISLYYQMKTIPQSPNIRKIQ